MAEQIGCWGAEIVVIRSGFCFSREYSDNAQSPSPRELSDYPDRHHHRKQHHHDPPDALDILDHPMRPLNSRRKQTV
jgi:hypothetical protein